MMREHRKGEPDQSANQNEREKRGQTVRQTLRQVAYARRCRVCRGNRIAVRVNDGARLSARQSVDDRAYAVGHAANDARYRGR